MNIGYLRSSASADDLQKELSALEQMGCERIVVDTAPYNEHHAGMLDAVIKRLSSGDTFVVWTLDSISSTMPELIDLVLELDAQQVRLRSVSEDFDTGGKHRKPLMAILHTLQQYQEQIKDRHETRLHSARRPGRPRSLSDDDVDRARSLLKEGVTIDETARQFQVSRATLYRYL